MGSQEREREEIALTPKDAIPGQINPLFARKGGRGVLLDSTPSYLFEEERGGGGIDVFERLIAIQDPSGDFNSDTLPHTVMQ